MPENSASVISLDSQAIVATGYKGYVAQEFNPKRPDPLASLRQAVKICDV